MSRKDYKQFAELVRKMKEKYPSTAHAIDEMAIHMADLFAEDNPSFDRGRFYETCGLTLD